jgi:hypothetical protein
MDAVAPWSNAVVEHVGVSMGTVAVIAMDSVSDEEFVNFVDLLFGVVLRRVDVATEVRAIW